MAEIVTGAMGTLLPKLANLIKGEYSLQKKLRGEIMFLEAELRSMEAALIKVSEAPIDQPPDIQVKLWTREVRELSYDLEDSIDRFMVHIGGGKQPSKKQSFKDFIDRSLKLMTKAKIKHNIATDIKEIRSRIKDVKERRDSYKVDLVPSKPVGRTIDNLRLSALYRKATELVGTEEKSNDLIKRLMECGNEKQQVIVSIVGSGGLGKTTLANLVYGNLKGQFHCGAIVYVSHNPNMDKIFKNMLYQLDGGKYENINHATWSEEQLISEIRKFLRHKRYFIVVDDIWNTSVWETIQYALIHNECGSIIITTTRNLDVAKQAGDVYQLEPLSLTDSTKLFYQRIFGSEDKCPPDDLVEMSEKILKKCGGVPLAIITIASMLSNQNGKEDTKKYWYHVYESMGCGLHGSTNMNDMRRILSVSYYDLPSCVKTCLLYLSLFPEDYEISVGDLITKWIGEGFVYKEQGKTLHEVGEAYVEELVNRSLIQQVDIGHGNKTVSCRVHDMVLDLICFLSNEENFLTKLDGQQTISMQNKIRRLSLKTGWEDEAHQLATMNFSHVRSLNVAPDVDIGLIPALSTFLVLRVLDLRYCEGIMNQHFKDICSLFHLRYLGLRCTSVTEIPKDIRKLKLLQVLDISKTDIKSTPSSFIHLTQLLYLLIDDYIRLPDGFGNLKSLQYVDGFISIESPSMMNDLCKLTQLRVLGIKFCEWNERYEKSFLQCLSNLVNLRFLQIDGCVISRLDLGCDNLSPGPQQLCSISIKGEGIRAAPRWMSNLCYLSSLDIKLLNPGVQELQLLGNIPGLSDLTLELHESTQARGKRLSIGDRHPFRCLTCLRIELNGNIVVAFAPGALQNLRVFYLRLGHDWLGDYNFGLEHLSSLEHVFLATTDYNYYGQAKTAIEKALEMNPNNPILEEDPVQQNLWRKILAEASVIEAALVFHTSSQ